MTHEQLTALKLKVEEMKKPETELIQSQYFDGDCCCAIGFLAKDNESCAEKLREYNTHAIAIWELREVNKWLMATYGLDKWQIVRVQMKNDIINKSYVIKYLEGIIRDRDIK